MHALLVKGPDELEGCIEGSPDEAEFASIADALEAYEELRWPLGKVPGGRAEFRFCNLYSLNRRRDFGAQTLRQKNVQTARRCTGVGRHRHSLPCGVE